MSGMHGVLPAHHSSEAYAKQKFLERIEDLFAEQQSRKFWHRPSQGQAVRVASVSWRGGFWGRAVRLR